MADKLKRCPFCGGEATLIHDTDCFSNPLIHIRCCDCRTEKTMYVDVKKSIEQNEAKAIEAWNNRPSPWHTGTPTEEGWYVIKTKHSSLFLVQKNSHGFWIEDKFGYEALVPTEGYIVAWQKIEPFKED